VKESISHAARDEANDFTYKGHDASLGIYDGHAWIFLQNPTRLNPMRRVVSSSIATRYSSSRSCDAEAEYCIAKLSSGYIAPVARVFRTKCVQDEEEVGYLHRNFDGMTGDGQQRTV
jgi:hypothetical protein